MAGRPPPSMSTNSDTQQSWHHHAETLGTYARSGHAPLAFLVGAGCSLSSGCPSLKRVEDVLASMPAQQRGELSAEFRLSPEETKRQLTPLFDGTSPNLGYYCLASLGRRCKTLVLNLNWDYMVERAADALGIAYLSYDLADDPTDIASAWDKLDAGLLVLHIHGKLDGSVRYTRNQTLHFTPKQQSLIDGVLVADRLISVGASLRYDHDVNAMLRNADATDPGYYFNRADDEADAADHSTRTMDTGRLFENRQWVTADFDFDTFMMLLVGAYRNRPYDASRSASQWAQLSLPKLADTLLPEPFVLRTALESVSSRGVAILDGAPLTGKAVCGSVLAHCLEICGAEDRSETRFLAGPDYALGALSSSSNASDTACLLLTSPFGEDRDFEENPSFLSTLAARVEADDPVPPIIVCCERSKLDASLADPDLEPAVIQGLRLPGSAWFSVDRLAAYADRQGRPEVLPAIRAGEVTSPWSVDAWDYANTPGFDEHVTDLHRLLETHADEASAICITYIGRFVTPIPLIRYADPDQLDATLLARFLHIYEFEGTSYARVANAIASAAVELYLRDHSSEFADTLAASFPSWRKIRVALERYHDAVRKHRIASSLGDSECDPGLTLHLLGAATPDSATEYLLSRPRDWWAAAECCYEVVRRWPMLRLNPDWRHWLERLAENDAGLYGLLEAALYYGHSTHPELWPEIETQLWKRITPGQPMSRTVALCADALLWRSSEAAPGLLRWIHVALRGIDETSELHGIFAFEAAYHTPGFHSLPERFRAKATLPITADQAAFAAWMVRWHSAHQSSMRMQQSRFGFHDKAFLCRSLYPSPLNNTAEVVHLVNQLGQYDGTAGWGFHAGCRWLHARTPDAALTNAARLSLRAAHPDDLGAITATLAYPAASLFSEQLTGHFAHADARPALLQTMRQGWDLEGVSIGPPRFEICADPLHVHRTAGLQFPNLARSGLFDDWTRFLRALDDAAARVLERKRVQPDVLERVLTTAESGDVADLEAVAAARDSDDLLVHVLEMACEEATRPSELF